MDFGQTLKTLRKQAGLTQQQLANQLGITKSVVSFYERRERTPSPDILIKLCHVFHVSADYLLSIKSADSIDVTGLDEDDIDIVRQLVNSLRKKHKK